jgi:hypothetical protein
MVGPRTRRRAWPRKRHNRLLLCVTVPRRCVAHAVERAAFVCVEERDEVARRGGSMRPDETRVQRQGSEGVRKRHSPQHPFHCRLSSQCSLTPPAPIPISPLSHGPRHLLLSVTGARMPLYPSPHYRQDDREGPVQARTPGSGCTPFLVARHTKPGRLYCGVGAQGRHLVFLTPPARVEGYMPHPEGDSRRA